MNMHPAYLAGIIDGEGTIILAKTGPARADGVRYRTLRVSVSNTNTGLLNAVQAAYGGVIRETMKASGNCKPGYSLRWFGEEAEAILNLIRQHLIVKAPQCELALEFRSKREVYGRYSVKPDEFHAEVHRIGNDISVLNKRGVA